MAIVILPTHYNAKQLNNEQRKLVAYHALIPQASVTDIARRHHVSRKFVYQQKVKATDAIDQAYQPSKQPSGKVLFYLPVTFTWLCQLILCLVLHCKASHRSIQKILLDAFDHSVSYGSIYNIITDAKVKAKQINVNQDLRSIKLAAEDEMFHYRQPILTGVDIPSLYCYLLSREQNRDFDTWATLLLDLQNQGLNPERVISDDADSIRAANQYVYPNMPCDNDHFHIIRDMIGMRRYFRNRLKSAITNRKLIQHKVDKAILTSKMETYHAQFKVAEYKESEIKRLSQGIDTLVDWMQHDVLNMPGLEPASRDDLFDFILGELEKLAAQHPHRIESVCISLKNQKPYLLAFTKVLDEKFQAIAEEFVFPLEKIWEMCALQRCQIGSDRYAIRSLPLQDYFGNEFDDVEDAVLQALDTTERTSSMIENLHSRLKPYFYLRREIGFDYLELLRFYINHTPFLRSERDERRGKTPATILAGKSHPHWLEMLGYQRFKKAA